MESGCDEVSLKHKEDIRLLEEDVQKIYANIQVGSPRGSGTRSYHVRVNLIYKMSVFSFVKVTDKELVLFQQKLEEEVKRDQKEKKANQEALKALKQEMEELVEEQRW